AFALPAPRLVEADLLKLRRSRSLAVVTAALTVGATAITIAVIELLHVSNAAKHGPAGGVTNLAHLAALIAMLGAAAAALVRSRAYAIGSVLAFRLAIMPLLASISALGIVRELLPNVALEALTPSALGDAARQGPATGMSTAAVAAVLIVWAVAAVVLAG